ncbi:neural-cadherin-like [Arapaima gigas]
MSRVKQDPPAKSRRRLRPSRQPNPAANPGGGGPRRIPGQEQNRGTFPLKETPHTIKATSPLGDPRVTYNLEEGQVPETNMPVRFYIKPNRADGSASILVAEPLDFESTRFFTLRVRVQNVAAVPLASFTTVYVNLTGEKRRPLRL